MGTLTMPEPELRTPEDSSLPGDHTVSATAAQTPADSATTAQQQLAAFLAANPETRCPKCSYTIGAIQNGICPECGLKLRLQCGPGASRGSRLWLTTYTVMAGSLGFAVLAPASNFLWHLAQKYLSTVGFFRPLLQFWPLLAVAILLAPVMVLFYQNQQGFDGLPAWARWLIGMGITAGLPALILIYMVYLWEV